MLITDQITPHFYARELVGRSGIPEDPTICANLVRLGVTVLEPLRTDWEAHLAESAVLPVSAAIAVIDGYRSPEENAAVGGAGQSKHMIGEAADIARADVDWRALRDGRGSRADQNKMAMFVSFVEEWARAGKVVGGMGIYTEERTGQLYWVHLDIRPRIDEVTITTWTGHHVGSEVV